MNKIYKHIKYKKLFMCNLHYILQPKGVKTFYELKLLSVH